MKTRRGRCGNGVIARLHAFWLTFNAIRRVLLALGVAMAVYALVKGGEGANDGYVGLAYLCIIVGFPLLHVLRLPFRAIRWLTKLSGIGGKRKPQAATDSPPLSFVAIDFETANNRYYSACALGVVVFEKGIPRSRRLHLMNPDCNFAPENVAIHGITAAQVVNAPRFDALWPELVPLFQRYRVVAYSDFDEKVLRSLIRHYGFKVNGSLSLDCFDVCQFARDSILGLTNYKLPTVAEFLNIEGLKHHDAVSDAETCGKIYVRLCAERGSKIVASADIPATYEQQDYIRTLGGRIPPTLSKSDASRMIDELLEKDRREKEDAETKRRRERGREKEERELQFMAAAMRTPEWKPTRAGSKRVRDLREFQCLVCRAVADGAIKPQEVLEIQAWLEAHKVLAEDFAQTLRMIADMKSGDGENDGAAFYCSLLDCLSELRQRPAL